MSDIKKYDAFISYRHLPLDKAVAKKLQSLLEHTKPPRGLVCKNTQRISRIFRDESELPTSGDLGQDIITALENSEYLVVLCSPKLKESKWCMQEIDYFKKIHGGRINRILPVLMEGDPADTFPDSIRYDTRVIVDENGEEHIEQIEVEPLACNIVAGGDIKKTLRRLSKSEFLRIAAPILGCGFDDLYRRHRRRKIQRAVITSAAAVFLSVAVSAIVITQNRSVVASRDAMFIELSNQAYISGQIPGAVEYALLALQPRGPFMPGILPQAQMALTTALGAYDFSDGFRPSETMTLPHSTVHAAISNDGKTAVLVSSVGVIVVDVELAEIIAQLPVLESAFAEAEFLDDNILLFASPSGLSAYDIHTGQILWTGEMASAIAVSADRSTIASIYLNEDRAVIYNTDGTVRDIVSFGGRSQRVPYHHFMANPGYNLLSLNYDGTSLAVSFDGSPLTVFFLTQPDMYSQILGTEGFVHFTGGFYGSNFAFSASGEGLFSLAMVIDMDSVELVFVHEEGIRPFMVSASEQGIFMLNANIHDQDIIMQIDTEGGDHRLAAYTDSQIVNFAVNSYGVIFATLDHSIKIFDSHGNSLARYEFGRPSDFVQMGKNYAVAASLATPDITIFERRDLEDATIFSYDPTIVTIGPKITRVNRDKTRVIRFSPWSFRLYGIEGTNIEGANIEGTNMDGTLINEVELPEGSRVFNQKFSHISGNLAHIHRDEALRIYSGEDGSLLFERDDLVSIFYAPFGISILDRYGTLSLVDLDTAQVFLEFPAVADSPAPGDFAAYIGMIVDGNFLNGGTVIGAARRVEGDIFEGNSFEGNSFEGSYLFVVRDWPENTGGVYDHNGERLFYIDIEWGPHNDVYFTDSAVIIAPLHGSPVVYDLARGERIRILDQEAYLTGVHQLVSQTGTQTGTQIGTQTGTLIGRYIVAEYLTAYGRRFGILMNPNFEDIAYLPWLTDVDILRGYLFFDQGSGHVRQSRIFSLEELVVMAGGQ